MAVGGTLTRFHPEMITSHHKTGSTRPNDPGGTAKMKAFISYSHEDKAALKRLHTHLAVLRQEGRIDAWFDHKTLAGELIDAEITKKLDSAKLILLLVSPDFLASDYCGKEMKRALGRHHSGQANVVPIILEPCDWHNMDLKNLKAIPKDGVPISQWPNENSAFLDVVQELRRVLEAVEAPRADDQGLTTGLEAFVQPKGHRHPVNKGFRVKREFDSIDRSDFGDKAFGVIRDYFESAIKEVDATVCASGRFRLMSETSFTCTIADELISDDIAHITVSRGDPLVGDDIIYVFAENAPPGTAHGSLTVEDDGYELYLESLFGISGHNERFTPEELAERLWKHLFEQVEAASI